MENNRVIELLTTLIASGMNKSFLDIFTAKISMDVCSGSGREDGERGKDKVYEQTCFLL